MDIPNVFFHPINKKNRDNMSQIARHLLESVISDSHIRLSKEIPIKVHSGQPGNITFTRPNNYDGVIDFLREKKIKTYFIETNMVTGPRSAASTHFEVARKHGFTRIPFVIADGEDGEDHVLVPVTGGTYIKKAKIARKLADKQQIIVMSHFKGHIDAGFGAAIKMLGIGFASRRGKIDVHSKDDTKFHRKTINWSESDQLYRGSLFRKRLAEYALAAVNKKHYIYLAFAVDIVKNCDCDGVPMEPIYKDLGIFASTDPVAIDKACFDMLTQREGKKPFSGDDVFPFAEGIGLGSQTYHLVIEGSK